MTGIASVLAASSRAGGLMKKSEKMMRVAVMKEAIAAGESEKGNRIRAANACRWSETCPVANLNPAKRRSPSPVRECRWTALRRRRMIRVGMHRRFVGSDHGEAIEITSKDASSVAFMRRETRGNRHLVATNMPAKIVLRPANAEWTNQD
jgi:hypothetical protein